MDWKDVKLSRSLRVFPTSQLPPDIVGRQEFISLLLNYPVFDEEGNDTGETTRLISDELAKRLTRDEDDN
jgi:hypothetical protein